MERGEEERMGREGRGQDEGRVRGRGESGGKKRGEE